MAEPTIRDIDREYLNRLDSRTASEIRTFHLVRSSRGVYCLDISRWFADLDAFRRDIPALLAGFGDSVLPAAPESVWAQMVGLSELHTKFSHSLVQLAPKNIGRIAMVEGDLSGAD